MRTAISAAALVAALRVENTSKHPLSYRTIAFNWVERGVYLLRSWWPGYDALLSQRNREESLGGAAVRKL